MPSYGRVAKTGFIWALASKGGAEIIGLFSTIILARVLTPNDFGVAAAASVFLQVASKLTNFGFNTALIQSKELREDHKSSVFVINFAAGTAIWLGLTVAAPWLAAFLRSPEVRIVLPVASIAFVINAFGAVPAALLAREMRFREIVLADWLYSVSMTIVAVAMGLSGFGYWSLVCSQIVAQLVQTCVKIAYTRWWCRWQLSRAAVRELAVFGLGLHAKRLLDSAALNIDNLVVGRMLGMTSLGLYDKAFATMNRAFNLLNAGGPAVSFRIFAIISDDQERFRAAYRRLILGSTLIGYPVLVWAAVSARELFLVMFGPQWVASVAAFQILCGVALVRFLTSYASTAVQAKGSVWREVWRQSIYLGLIVLGVTIGSRWGLAGAAAGVLLATVILAGFMQELLRRVSSVSWRDFLAPQMPAAVCALLVATLVWAVRILVALWVMNPSPWLVLGLDAIVGATATLVFGVFAPIASVRSVVDETLAEFTPGLVRWMRRPRR